ncbi:hypothetical protein A9179_13205 [Pseudomonas alcaligenes]|uniref:Uncharacterized protein n=1 Tax=Aquipseudomonas alcaligenes TaxID=43263 RepID=A0ABR7S3S2_AQUAC|nr:hypothetical protein [Pseudomonas alcaligenes]MBC9251236.1 hypothetical protein [Pseudomonas alcaligenes]
MTARWLVPLLLSFSVISACTLDRSVIAAMPGGSLSATPSLACAGDTVTIAWDTHRPRNPAFCAFGNGNTPTLQRCESSAGCSAAGAGAICLDNFCNNCSAVTGMRRRQAECASPSNQGCEPNLNARIEITPEPDPPLADASEITLHRGERSFVINESSAIAFRGDVIDAEGQRAGVDGAIGRVDLDARVEVVSRDFRRIAANAYECLGGTRNWGGTRLEDLFAGASSTIHLVSIHNPNSYAVVGSLNGSPLRLAARETINVDLPLVGVIQAQPDPDFLRTLPPVQCTASHVSGSLPSAPLQLTAACAAP